MNITKTTEDMHDSTLICMEVPGRNKIIMKNNFDS